MLTDRLEVVRRVCLHVHAKGHSHHLRRMLKQHRDLDVICNRACRLRLVVRELRAPRVELVEELLWLLARPHGVERTNKHGCVSASTTSLPKHWTM